MADEPTEGKDKLESMIVAERGQNNERTWGVVAEVDRGKLVDSYVISWTNKTTILANITTGGFNNLNERREIMNNVAENNGLLVTDPKRRIMETLVPTNEKMLDLQTLH